MLSPNALLRPPEPPVTRRAPGVPLVDGWPGVSAAPELPPLSAGLVFLPSSAALGHVLLLESLARLSSQGPFCLPLLTSPSCDRDSRLQPSSGLLAFPPALGHWWPASGLMALQTACVQVDSTLYSLMVWL